jgi:formylglycine-generating enzyme required for sulfatase activity
VFVAFAVAAVATAGGFALRWREGLNQLTLRDRDIGTSELTLRAFDWDPRSQRVTVTPRAEMSWQLVHPLPRDGDQPGERFTAGDLSSEGMPPLVDAVRHDRIAARGGPAVLVIARRDRQHHACSPVIVPIRRLPGHGEHRSFQIQIPTCEATRADLIHVPAGTFIAGGPGEPPSPDQVRYRDHEHAETLAGYWLDRTELSNAMLAAVADAWKLGDRTLPIYPDADEYAHASEPDHPVASLTWYDAAVACRMLGKRLPSSAEWQKALRGGMKISSSQDNPWPRRNLPWGPAEDAARANINHGSEVGPRAVGSHTEDVGPYGHLDLLGNLTEWTADRRGNGFVVLRGGNWADTTPDKILDLGAIENPRPPHASMYTFGVRCAMDAETTATVTPVATASPPATCVARDCPATR